MARMTDKIALVVGGAKGIGLATARALAEEGATVFLTGRSGVEIEAAASAVGHGARGLVADAARQDDLARVVETVVQSSGRIDALVLNAGVSEPGAIGEVTAEHFDGLFSVNVRGAVFGLQAALPAMREGGAVVLIGSVAGSLGVPGYGTYAATKAALRSYARTWTGAARHPDQRRGPGTDGHGHDGRRARGGSRRPDRPDSARPHGAPGGGRFGGALSPERRSALHCWR
jgi:NAD(P)-dependent dehydrogenase (short-subunit alcohol dehydrogenase family)